MNEILDAKAYSEKDCSNIDKRSLLSNSDNNVERVDIKIAHTKTF